MYFTRHYVAMPLTLDSWTSSPSSYASLWTIIWGGSRLILNFLSWSSSHCCTSTHSSRYALSLRSYPLCEACRLCSQSIICSCSSLQWRSSSRASRSGRYLLTISKLKSRIERRMMSLWPGCCQCLFSLIDLYREFYVVYFLIITAMFVCIYLHVFTAYGYLCQSI